MVPAAIERYMKNLVQAAERSLSPALVLALTFAALYTAVGPGYLYSVDEVNDVETAQAVLERGTLEVPAMHVLVSRQGVAGGHYSVNPPALAYVGLPLVALGNLLDDAAGSLNGGAAQDRPRARKSIRCVGAGASPSSPR